MNGREKSGPAIVAIRPNEAVLREKSANEAERSGSESMQPRAGAEEKAIQQSAFRTQGRADASQALERIRQAARRNQKERFTALLHHITPEVLEKAFRGISKEAAPGIDGMMRPDYEADLKFRLADLHARVHSGAYRATPSRRVYIPKPDGGRRPLAVSALEDKIVQRATAAVLIPTRGGNGAMEALMASGQFEPPSLGTLEAAMEYGLSLKAGRVFADLWGMRERCAYCPPQRLARLRQMNLQQVFLDKISCARCFGAS